MIPNLSPALSEPQAPGARGGGGADDAGRGGPGARPIANGELLDKGSPFVHGESELAEVTGIALKKFARQRTRHLRQGVDWDLNGLRVCYSHVGIGTVLQLITGEPVRDGFIAGVALSQLEEKSRLASRPWPEAHSVPHNGIEPHPAIAVLQARVTRFFPNPHLLEATLLEGDRKIHVRVRSQKNFRLRMQIPVMAAQGGGVFELARREPRFPGRW